MKLDQEISFKSISKLFEKKKPVKELKTEIDFFAASRTEKKQISGVIPATIAAVIVIAVIGKFAVLDRYAMLFSRQASVQKLESDIENANEVLENSGELRDRYYHFTTSMMTEDEKNNASRADVMDLLRYIDEQGVKVSSTTLSGNIMVVSVEGKDLKSISILSQSLKLKDIVSTVTVTTAQTYLDEDETKSEEGVTASVTVYLKTKTELQEVEG